MYMHAWYLLHTLFFQAPLVDDTSSSSSPTVAGTTREDLRLSAILSIGSGFVLEALEKRSIQLTISLLTQMVGKTQNNSCRAAIAYVIGYKM